MIMNEEQAKRYALLVRKMFEDGDNVRDAGLETPAYAERFDDIVYGTDCPKWQSLDVYRPKGTAGPLPVILSVHGGGWVYGDKERYQYYCMSLVQFGFAVVNFSYRLAPEYKYPASFEDLDSVCRWIFDHREEFGFDTDHVFAVGDSAGAHMLSLYCCALTNPSFRSTLPYSVQDQLRFRAVALNCGVYDLQKAKPEIRNLLQNLFPVSAGDAQWEQIDTCLHISAGFPPVYLMAASDDNLKEQTFLLKPLLEEYDIPFVFRVYGSDDHPLPHVFHCNMKLEDAFLCNREETDFFRSCIEIRRKKSQ